VLIGGRVEVATPEGLESGNYRGALQISTRHEVVQRAGGGLSDPEVTEQAAERDTAVPNLGG
jgi:hypothetical protein